MNRDNPNQRIIAMDAISVTAAPTDGSVTLTPTSKTYEPFRVIANVTPSGGANINDFKVKFYDGDPAGSGTAISEDMWLSAQPSEGFPLRHTVTGDLYARITGWTTGTLAVRFNVHYTWR